MSTTADALNYTSIPSNPPPSLLSLSNELLSIICSYAMTYTPSRHEHHPPGIIGDQLHKKLRILLRPMRSCKRLYIAAKHAFLESNTVVLDLSDIRMSAMRLEHQPSIGQLLYTGNPDPLLARLVHVQVCISILDTRMRNSLPRDAANLLDLERLCRGLKSLHVFLKVDAWYATETDLDIQGTLRHQLGDSDVRFREHAEAVLDVLARMHIRYITVAFYEWDAGVERVDAREMGAKDVLAVLLDEKMRTASLVRAPRRIARVRSGGLRRVETAERTTLKMSWGVSDDIRRVSTV